LTYTICGVFSLVFLAITLFLYLTLPSLRNLQVGQLGSSSARVSYINSFVARGEPLLRKQFLMLSMAKPFGKNVPKYACSVKKLLPKICIKIQYN
jgi:hypothetical protein